jgi:hypothetical protein
MFGFAVVRSRKRRRDSKPDARALRAGDRTGRFEYYPRVLIFHILLAKEKLHDSVATSIGVRGGVEWDVPGDCGMLEWPSR